MTLVEYKGLTADVMWWEEVSDEKLEELRKEYYQKSSKSEVKKELKTISRGGSLISKVNKYYFRDLQARVKKWNSKWAVADVFESNALMGIFMARIHNQNVYTKEDGPDIKKIETALRIGAKGIAAPITNFNIKNIDNLLLSKYNVNNNYYDYSCGWGVRLLSAMRNNVNYFGTDPNHELYERLLELKEDYKSVAMFSNSTVDIRNSGSEVFHEDWKNKMGLAFSSPPYFLLEDYKTGEQSAQQDTSYEDWQELYLRPTFRNIKEYLIDEGYFMINIKDYSKFTLEADSKRIAIEEGFEFIENIPLSPINRYSPKDEKVIQKSDEYIMVFRKKL